MRYLAYMYFYVLCVFAFAISFIYWDVKKTRLVKWEEVPKNNQKIIKKYEKSINRTIKIIGTIASVLMSISYYREILDFPSFITSNYIQVTGVVIEDDVTAEESLMQILTLDVADSNEKIEVWIWGKEPYKVGNVITVNFLKNSKQGYVVE